MCVVPWIFLSTLLLKFDAVTLIITLSLALLSELAFVAIMSNELSVKKNNYITKQRGRACYFFTFTAFAQVSFNCKSFCSAVGWRCLQHDSLNYFTATMFVSVDTVVDTVVDQQTGFAAQRERVMAAVPDQHMMVMWSWWCRRGSVLSEWWDSW